MPVAIRRQIVKSRKFPFLGILILASLLSACEMSDKDKKLLEDSLAESAPSDSSETQPGPIAVEPDENQAEAECFQMEDRQPTAQLTHKIDLLFVTDTSGSLANERQSVADGIESFINEFPIDIDLRVAVMPAHGSRGSHSGKLTKAHNEPFVLDLQDLGTDYLKKYLSEKLYNPPTDRFSDGGEEGLYSLSRSLDNGMSDAIKAHGFYRPDAALAVVFISDENDICARYEDSSSRVYDPEHLELPAFLRDCADVTPESTLEKLKNFKGDRPLLVAGIHYVPGSYVPALGENEAGYGYIEMIQAANGIVINMADGKIAEGLGVIGSLASSKLNLKTEFNLGHDATTIDPSSISVSVDDESIETFQYNSDLNEVQLLEYAGRAGSSVKVNYCLLPVEEDDGSAGSGDGTTPDDGSAGSGDGTTPDDGSSGSGDGTTPDDGSSSTTEPAPTPEPDPVPAPEPDPIEVPRL